MRGIFVSTLLDLAKKDPNLILVTGDLGFGVLKPFWDELPSQIINIGIAEQNMIGFAAGLAMQGKLVYVYSIANFPSLRPLEQIRNDVAYHNLNVKIVSVGAGFSYGSLGVTHHATEDIGVIRSMPNIRIYSPSDNYETEFITRNSYLINGPAYLRLGRLSKDLVINGLNEITVDKPRFKNTNSLNAIITNGEISHQVFELINKFESQNIYFDFYIFHTIKPLNTSFINQIAKKYERLFVIEEHSKYGGLSSAIKDELYSFEKVEIHSFSINDKFTLEVGDQDFLKKINKLDNNSLYNQIISIINS